MIKAVVFDMYETLVTMFDCPAYKGADIAKDIGIEEATFRKIWNPSENPRSLGDMSFEDVIRFSLNANNRYSDELLQKIIDKRISASSEYFNHLHPDIIPMLQTLRASDIKIALISNCYFEERDAIKGSLLWEFFDAACLSCEEKLMKPDKEIYFRCLERLGFKAEECLYVGDGGSFELETAREVGMKPVQACWYLKEGTNQVGRLEDFPCALSPMDIVEQLSIGAGPKEKDD